MVPLDTALIRSYRLSIVTMSLTAAVWPQFATQVFRGGIGRLTCIGSYVNKQVTTFAFRAQATTCSKHHTWTVMDAGCECAPRVRSAHPSDSWALVCCRRRTHKRGSSGRRRELRRYETSGKPRRKLRLRKRLQTALTGSAAGFSDAAVIGLIDNYSNC